MKQWTQAVTTKRLGHRTTIGIVVALLLLTGAWSVNHFSVTHTPTDLTGETAKKPIVENYGKLPLRFESNAGQLDEQVKFVTRGRGYAMFFTANEAVLSLQNSGANQVSQSTQANDHASSDTAVPSRQHASSVVRMKLVGANPDPVVTAQNELPGKSNYFRGNDPAKWRTNVPSYEKVHYDEVYDGIDLVYYGNQQRLEYDFIVQPGADPEIIRMRFKGLAEKDGNSGLALTENGDLLLQTEGGEIRQQKPFIYQEINGDRQQIDGEYELLADNQIAFAVADYDLTRPLVIDPILLYSTYIGGGAEEGVADLAVDSSGNAYIVGATNSSDFPTTSGAYATTLTAPIDIFVAKLNPTGSSLIYATFIDGLVFGPALAVDVDNIGNAYLAGTTVPIDFPTTSGAFQTSFSSPSLVGFVTKLNATGSALLYSTFLGGSEEDRLWDIAVDGSGNAHVTGSTESSDFPTTSGALATTKSRGFDVFVTKLNPAGSALLYSTYLGGSDREEAQSITVDGSGSAYVTGDTHSSDFPTTSGAFATTISDGDAFVSKLNADGSALLYSTYLGGSSLDDSFAIAVDGSGNAYVAGRTRSSDFPTTPGAVETTFQGGGVADNDGFVSKLNATGSALVYSTYLAGNESDLAFNIAVDGSGNAYVTGGTSSTDFPVTSDALFPTSPDGNDDFFTILNSTGSALLYSTFIGVPGEEDITGVAVDGNGNAYLAGVTGSDDFPVTSGAFDVSLDGSGDGFVMKFGEQELTIINDLIQVKSKNVQWHSGTNQLSFDIAFKNISGTDITDVQARIDDLNPAPPTITVNNADNDSTGLGAIFDYSDELGSDNMLSPSETSGYKTWIFDDPSAVNFTFFANVLGNPAALPKFASGQSSSERLAFAADVKNSTVDLMTPEEEVETALLPQQFQLHQNYPNPFNPETKIRYNLPEAAQVKLIVYNLKGQQIKTLENAEKPAGSHEIIWNARDDFGRPVASGVYIYRIVAGDFSQVRKLTLVR